MMDLDKLIELNSKKEVKILSIKIEWFNDFNKGHTEEDLPLVIVDIDRYTSKVYRKGKAIPFNADVYLSVSDIGIVDGYIDLYNNNQGFDGKEVVIENEQQENIHLKGPYKIHQFNKGYKAFNYTFGLDLVECGFISEGVRSRGFILLNKIKQYIDLPFVEIKDRPGFYTPSFSENRLLKPDNKNLSEI